MLGSKYITESSVNFHPWIFDPCLSYLYLNLTHTRLTLLSVLLLLLLPLHRTIVYLSLVYTLGQIIMAISAIHDITDHNKDGTPDDMTLHMWVERTLGFVWPKRNRWTHTDMLTECLCCVVPTELCPWWGCCSLPWEREASSPAWPPSVETSLKTIRLDVARAHPEAFTSSDISKIHSPCDPRTVSHCVNLQVNVLVTQLHVNIHMDVDRTHTPHAGHAHSS